jgi:tyrosyl-tRNA synthetase
MNTIFLTIPRYDLRLFLFALYDGVVDFLLYFFYFRSRFQVHGKAKMKKAFCEPGNVSLCPPIVLASTFALGKFSLSASEGRLLVERSEENGGNRTYASREEIEADFLNGTLHPGDLKGSVSNVMVQVLDRLTTGAKNDKDAANSKKILLQFQKKQAKKK